MALQWTSVQPTAPGRYWAAIKDSEKFVMVEIGSDGNLINDTFAAYDLWSWPVEVPPAPVRAKVAEAAAQSMPAAQPAPAPEPAKDVTSEAASPASVP